MTADALAESPSLRLNDARGAVHVTQRSQRHRELGHIVGRRQAAAIRHLPAQMHGIFQITQRTFRIAAATERPADGGEQPGANLRTHAFIGTHLQTRLFEQLTCGDLLALRLERLGRGEHIQHEFGHGLGRFAFVRGPVTLGGDALVLKRHRDGECDDDDDEERRRPIHRTHGG